MQARLPYSKAYPDAYKAMLTLSQVVAKTGLSPQLIDLVNYRVSLAQWLRVLPRHAFEGFACPRRDRAASLHDQRMAPGAAYLHIYSSRERAALAEAVTRLENQQVADAAYETASQEFSDAELAQLTLAVVAINGWNRFNVALRTPAGSYQSTVTGCGRPAGERIWSGSLPGRAGRRPRDLLADITNHADYMTIARHVRAFGVGASDDALAVTEG
jgi:hypothetical protein